MSEQLDETKDDVGQSRLTAVLGVKEGFNIFNMLPKWSPHVYGYGEVCHCGYHGKTNAGRAVHNRRAARGLGCSVPNV